MAQQQEATLLLKIKTAGESALSGITSMFNKIGIVGGAVFAAVSAAVYKSIDAYGEYEKSVNTLTQAMINSGTYSSQLKNSYIEMANALEDLTGMDDDAIIKSQGVMQSLIGQKKVTKELMQATIDLAAAKGIDLNTAATMVGKTIDQETNYLKRQGIEFDNTKQGAERYSAVIDAINGKYAGMAAKQTEGIGSTVHFKNAIDDLYKAIGSHLAPAFVQATAWATSFIKALTPDMATQGLQKINEDLNKLGARLAELNRLDSSQVDAGTQNLINQLQKRYDQLRAQKQKHLQDEQALQAEADANAKSKREAEDAEEQTRLSEKNIKQLEAQMAFDTGYNEYLLANEDQKNMALLQMQMSYLDKQIAATDDAKTKENLIRAKALVNASLLEEKSNQDRIKNQRDTFSTIATLQSSGNSTLAAIGKAAAITQIAIDTPVAISKAWTLGPILGPPAAALVATAMAAQAARIAGVQLAEGGIVMPRPGGVQATIAEAGQAEAVIPLDRAGEFGLGGGGVTINFNGPILGDDSQARAFAEKIDVELYKLRKSNSSVAFDSGIV